MTGNEERAILKDLNQLKSSLPLIKEVDNMEDKARDVKDNKKVIGRKLREKIDEKNTLRDKINEIKEKQKTEQEKEGEKDVKDNKKDGEKPLHPLTVKLNAVKDGIDKCRDQKTALKKAHDDSYKAWRDQNDLELKIKWIRKQKDKLKKVQEEEERHALYKAEEEKRKAEIEEHEKLYGKPKKYQSEIDTCVTLIAFLESLKPKQHDSDLALNQQASYNEANVNDELKSGDWKKEKVHILKKEEDDWAVPGGLSKKKNKKNKSKGKATQEEQKISLNIDILNDFDKVKVQPPLYMKEIDATLTKLNEKKTYFTKISDDLNEGKEVVVAGEENGEKKEDSENTESEPTKKERKAKVNLDDENMFPDL